MYKRCIKVKCLCIGEGLSGGRYNLVSGNSIVLEIIV